MLVVVKIVFIFVRGRIFLFRAFKVVCVLCFVLEKLYFSVWKEGLL